MTMKNLLQQFLEDETGATAVEYGLIIVMLSLVIIGGVKQAADALQWLFSDNSSRLVQAFSH